MRHVRSEDFADSLPATPPRGRFGWLRRWFARADRGDAAMPSSWWAELVEEDRADAFLRLNHLPRTPANHELASALLATGNIVSAPEEQPSDEAAALAALIEKACGTLTSAAALVTGSGEDARAYGAALASTVAEFDDAASPAAVTASLVDLTRAMIAKSVLAHDRLREMSERIETLQEDLQEAQQNASLDTLTGLPNRRALETGLKRMVDAARMMRGAVSIALCDIDHFKQINDRHGHDVGDRTLRLVADILSTDASADCMIGRYGGEEFLILLEDYDAESAAHRIEALRADLARRHLRSRDTDEPIGQITFSAGVAALGLGETAADLLRRADAALYRAKHEGRDRVVIDQPKR
jgi:diguanylate cyclase